MRIFFVGDFILNTGPGVANKILRKGLKNKDELYSDCKNKLGRVIELVIKILIADGVCFCSYSKSNFIGLKIAKIFKKKSFYIMHGYKTYEYKINNIKNTTDKVTEINNEEKYIFENVEKVFCVSKKFMEFMKEAEPQFAEKFDCNYNGIDLEKIENTIESLKMNKKKKQIISIGGGMKRKNNLAVCKAISKLNQEKDLKLEYIVIGLPYTDKQQICSFDFVTYYDQLPYDKVLEILSQSYLYIQNSIFETFGLAVVEALLCNCNLLISNKIGAVDIIETLEKRNLIYDTSDIEEIADKIEYLLIDGNAEKLKEGICKDEIDCNLVGGRLIEKISKQINQ